MRGPPRDRAGATLGVLGAGFVGMALTKKQFFPTSARLELLVDVNLRAGAGFAATRAAVEARRGRDRGRPRMP